MTRKDDESAIPLEPESRIERLIGTGLNYCKVLCREETSLSYFLSQLTSCSFEMAKALDEAAPDGRRITIKEGRVMAEAFVFTFPEMEKKYHELVQVQKLGTKKSSKADTRLFLIMICPCSFTPKFFVS